MLMFLLQSVIVYWSRAVVAVEDQQYEIKTYINVRVLKTGAKYEIIQVLHIEMAQL